MKDKNLPPDNNTSSLEELTDQANQIIESLENEKDLNNSVESLIGKKDNQFPNPSDQKLFKIPPLRNFLLNKNEINREIDKLNNFDIYQSFNKGGLANGWGANCVPYNKNDINDWDLDQEDFFLSQKKIFKGLVTDFIKF